MGSVPPASPAPLERFETCLETECPTYTHTLIMNKYRVSRVRRRPNPPPNLQDQTFGSQQPFC